MVNYMVFNDRQVQYKTYVDKTKPINRRVALEPIIAEELNKICAVMREDAHMVIGTSVIVDIALRYLFELMDTAYDDVSAMEMLSQVIMATSVSRNEKLKKFAIDQDYSEENSK